MWLSRGTNGEGFEISRPSERLLTAQEGPFSVDTDLGSWIQCVPLLFRPCGNPTD
jgi:hypothetical protein